MDLSIVIVSYNTLKLLKTCVDTIKKFTKGVDFEIIVVDNNSKDGSLEWLERQKGIKLIKNKDNVGFSKANNQGIKNSSGKYILLLNSDTKLTENSLLKMTKWMDTNTNVGVATCKLRNLNGSTQATGGYFPNLPRIFLWATFLDDLPFVNVLGTYHPHSGGLAGDYYTKERKLDWVTGAFFLIKREVVKVVGVLDEDFFMYVEELEYCYRIKKAGWDIFYTPITEIIHVGGASGVRENSILGEFRNLKLFYKKHKSYTGILLLEMFLKVAAILRILAYGLTGRMDIAKIYAKALV